ncbi:MAG: Sir2 family transcriptional regulator, partial [Methylococcaceae bacterium]|nr:Sir2 family transcriptional regulator [Methylococcaceae bacterium]
ADKQLENYYRWKESVEGCKQVTIEIGAGSSVGGIRNSSQNMPCTLIRINPREAEGPKNTISIPMTALAALEAIDAVLNKF